MRIHSYWSNSPRIHGCTSRSYSLHDVWMLAEKNWREQCRMLTWHSVPDSFLNRSSALRSVSTTAVSRNGWLDLCRARRWWRAIAPQPTKANRTAIAALYGYLIQLAPPPMRTCHENTSKRLMTTPRYPLRRKQGWVALRSSLAEPRPLIVRNI